MKRIIPQKLKTVNLFYECSLFEIAVGKQKELVNLPQNISERAGNMSERTDGNFHKCHNIRENRALR